QRVRPGPAGVQVEHGERVRKLLHLGPPMDARRVEEILIPMPRHIARRLSFRANRSWLHILAFVMLGLSVRLSVGQTDAPTATAAGSAVDPLFVDPYVDMDEWRDVPVRHRYVHGGFKGTET